MAAILYFNPQVPIVDRHGIVSQAFLRFLQQLQPQSGGGPIGGTISVGQVAVGTALNTIGGAGNFTWDGTNLTLNGIVYEGDTMTFTTTSDPFTFAFPNVVVAFTGADEYTFDATVNGTVFSGTFNTTQPFNGRLIQSVKPDQTTNNFVLSNVSTAVDWALNEQDNTDFVIEELAGNTFPMTLTQTGNATFLGTVSPSAFVFTALPAAPVMGMSAVVTDSNTNTWGATIAGGGANTVQAWYNGSNWTVTGK